MRLPCFLILALSLLSGVAPCSEDLAGKLTNSIAAITAASVCGAPQADTDRAFEYFYNAAKSAKGIGKGFTKGSVQKISDDLRPVMERELQNDSTVIAKSCPYWFTFLNGVVSGGPTAFDGVFD